MAVNSSQPPPVTVVYKTRPAKMSCWHGVSIALMSAFNAFAIIFFIKVTAGRIRLIFSEGRIIRTFVQNAFAYDNVPYVDALVEKCGKGYHGFGGT